MALLLLLVGAVYWFTVPAARVNVVTDRWHEPILQQVWASHAQSRLMFLNRSSVAGSLGELPVTDVAIRRQRPWNAVVTVDIADPDLVVRQGKVLAAVFLAQGTAYAVPAVSSSWKVLDVTGFPRSTPGFLATSLEYASICNDLLQHRNKLAFTTLSLSSSAGLSARLKDGKTLVLGDGTNGTAKIDRAVAVISMTAFRDKAVTIDLRFDGQAVIPGTP